MDRGIQPTGDCVAIRSGGNRFVLGRSDDRERRHESTRAAAGTAGSVSPVDESRGPCGFDQSMRGH